MQRLAQVFASSLLAAGLFGLVALLAPAAEAGKGKGNGPPGPGNPPDCPCAEVIEPAPGVVCVLDWCVELVPDGYECGYVCLLPY